MDSYRVEMRIFGLLTFALIATIALYFGLSAADVSGPLFGLEVRIAGPAAFFVVLILVFRLTRLFTLGLEEVQMSARPADTLSPQQIDKQLDMLTVTFRRVTRRKKELEDTRAALGRGESPEEALEAGGMRRAGRPSRPTPETG